MKKIPSSLFVTGGSLRRESAPCAGTAYAWKSSLGFLHRLIVCAVFATPLLHATITISSFTVSPASPQPVGTSVTLTAMASDTAPGDIRYRFSVKPPGGSWGVVRDYSPVNTLDWVPFTTDGLYNVQVTVLNRSTLQTKQKSLPYTVTPVATGSTPVVRATSHPLVALYSAPICPTGSTIKVRFKLPADTRWTATSSNKCYGTSTNNFYIAGMRSSSTYQIRQWVTTGSQQVAGPLLQFTTGAITVTLPPVTAILPLQPPSDQTDPVLLFAGLEANGYPLFAVDASLNPIWYSVTQEVYMSRPVTGGDYLATYGFTTDLTSSGMREYDLVGNLIKETNVERMNDQLAAIGMNPITVFHHEIRKTSCVTLPTLRATSKRAALSTVTSIGSRRPSETQQPQSKPVRAQDQLTLGVVAGFIGRDH